MKVQQYYEFKFWYESCTLKIKALDSEFQASGKKKKTIWVELFA